LINNKQNVLYS